jgi:hypothetical protein
MSLRYSIDARNGTAVLDTPRTNGHHGPSANAPFHTWAKVGHPAPAFSMPTTHDLQRLQSRVALEDYRGHWLVLFFYRIRNIVKR